MESEKIDQSLQLALQIPSTERETSSFLDYGYEPETRLWQIIVKHTGQIRELEQLFPDTTVTELLNGYAIIETREENIERIAALSMISYIEKPKQLYFNLQAARTTSCLSEVQKPASSTEVVSENSLSLSGKDILIAIIDSGIDYTHPTFIKETGESRILFLWDQAASAEEAAARRPAGYPFGAQYTSEDLTAAINKEITLPNLESGSGHGTAVAGIAAGNGNGSPGNRYRGVATESSLLVVKLGRKTTEFSGTTEVMLGVDYAVRKSLSLQMPIAINLSFGTNDGAHDGLSLFENYLSDLKGVGKNSIIIASGNEGDARHHAKVTLSREAETVELSIGANERSLSLQLWKDYSDVFSIVLESPSGKQIFFQNEVGVASRHLTDGNEILFFYGSPTPFTMRQEIFIEWLPGRNSTFVRSGVWKLILLPGKIINGTVHLYLPTIEAIGKDTGFLSSIPDNTLTIPASARNVITTGAYQTVTDIVAAFSGRGNTIDGRIMPTLVAPGVDVVTALPGGRYGGKTGTSIAAPFVTGSAALLMEWGIVRGNDPFLYGEKLKAYLIKGARRLPEQQNVPDTMAGYGALCVRDSVPDI